MLYCIYLIWPLSRRHRPDFNSIQIAAKKFESSKTCASQRSYTPAELKS